MRRVVNNFKTSAVNEGAEVPNDKQQGQVFPLCDAVITLGFQHDLFIIRNRVFHLIIVILNQVSSNGDLTGISKNEEFLL